MQVAHGVVFPRLLTVRMGTAPEGLFLYPRMTTTQAEALREACRCLVGDLFCIALPWLLNGGDRVQ